MSSAIIEWVGRSLGTLLGAPLSEAPPAMFELLLGLSTIQGHLSPFPDRSEIRLDSPPSVVEPMTLPPFPLTTLPRGGFEEEVEYSLCIDASGRAVRVLMLGSSGWERLDRNLRHWPYELDYAPAIKDGEPIGVCGYKFELSLQLER